MEGFRTGMAWSKCHEIYLSSCVLNGNVDVKETRAVMHGNNKEDKRLNKSFLCTQEAMVFF